MKLRYIIIKVKDIERAKSFYSRFLNMEPTKVERDRMVVFDLQNIKIGLYNPVAVMDILYLILILEVIIMLPLGRTM